MRPDKMLINPPPRKSGAFSDEDKDARPQVSFT